MPTRSPNSRSVMIARFLFVTALRGKLRRFSCCKVFGPPRSSGQVSNATQGVIAIRALLGHLIGWRRGLTFILPPQKAIKNFSTHATVPTACQRHEADSNGHLQKFQIVPIKKGRDGPAPTGPTASDRVVSVIASFS